MQPSLRPLLFAAGAFLASALPASAQFIELLTEARVTLQVTLTTTVTTTTGNERKNVSTVTRLTEDQIMRDLVGGDPAGWTLVAVRAAPSDLTQVDGEFHLYAVNGAQRTRINAAKFATRAFGSAEKYKERHLGQYILDSGGTATNHVAYAYRPSLPFGNGTLTIADCVTDGFATIGFKTRDVSDDYEAFFYAINSLRATTRGSFTANTGQGLITLTVNVGPAKLVPATTYPGIDTFTSELLDN